MIKLEKTKRGFAAAWESGGGWTSTGSAFIIAGPKGEAPAPLYVRRRGELACEDHALIVVKAGFFVVNARHHRRDFTIRVSRIMKIKDVPCGWVGDRWALPDYKVVTGLWYSQPSPTPPKRCPKCGGTEFAPVPVPDGTPYWTCSGKVPAGETELVAEFSRGEWDNDPPDFLSAAIEAAKDKATCYHCREPHFVTEAAPTTER